MPPRVTTLTIAFALFASVAGIAHAKTIWLCKPGIHNNPCVPSLTTTRFSPAGHKLGVEHVRRAARPKIDCFYVYPTVSDQPSLQANLHIDPIERSIALYNAAYFSRECRVFAPMYRQLTLVGILSLGRVTRQMLATEYNDVARAWREYLARYNHGRGVVLLGHSQGSILLDTLISREIDSKPSVRRRIVSAILPGGNVLVRSGRDVGGDFKHLRACRARTQLGCVVAYSTFNGPVPANALFGRSPAEGDQVLCTNPATLGARTGTLDSIFPTAPLAPGILALEQNQLEGGAIPTAPTPWIQVRGAYRGRCSSAGGANVLQVTGAPQLHPAPDATWGIHLADVNIALGNLVDLVHSEAAAYAAARG